MNQANSQPPQAAPQSPVFRFAPSPNGYLHAGHAYSALLNAELARQMGGRLLLRIEDIDVTRCKAQYVAAVHEDLAWLGVAFDGETRRQSDHFATYRQAIDRLVGAGLAYPCFCTRADIAAAASRVPGERDPDGAPLYSGCCRRLPAEDIAAARASGRPFALRLRMDQAVAAAGTALSMTGFDRRGVARSRPVHPLSWGDVVLARKETPTSYHASVVIDDALQGVTHVVRGQDLEAATAIHRVLQELWRLPAPLYLHHDLVRDATGQRLAKSFGSTALRQLRAEGVTAADIKRQLGFPDI